MSNLKKMLSVFMAVAMLMSVMVMGTGAAFTDQKDVKNTEATDMAVALGIIKGYEDGSFKPTANVTRAEMAKMICIMLNAGKEPSLGTVTNYTFTDTGDAAWAAPYIEYCATAGIVAGMGNNTFAPNATVTATQAAKMLLVAMGYDAAVEGFNGTTWSVKINFRASSEGLYTDLSVDPNAPLNRDNAAQMVWNALNADMVEYKSELGVTNGNLGTVKTLQDKTILQGSTLINATLLKEKFKTEADVVGRMESYKWNKTDKKFEYYICKGETFPSGTNVTHDTVKFTTATDYTGLYGLNVKVVYKKDSNRNDTVYGMFAKDSKVIARGTLKDLESNANDTIKFDGTKYKLDVFVEANKAEDALNNFPLWSENKDMESVKTAVGSIQDTETTRGVLTNKGTTKMAYEVKLIDRDNDGKVDYGVYLPFEYGKVSSVGTKSISLTDGSITSVRIEDANIYQGIAKDDYVKVIPAKNSAYTDGNGAVIKMETFEGAVTATKSGKIQIDGTWYTDGNNVSVNVGTKSTFAKVGNFVYFADQKQSASVENLLYLAAYENGTLGDKGKVYFTDGTSNTVGIKEFRDPTGTKLSTKPSAPANTMYTFSKSGGDYVLTQIGPKSATDPTKNNNNLGYSYAIAAKTATITKATDNKSGKLELDSNSYSFADDAIVFIEKGATSSDVKVVTGKVARDYASLITGDTGAQVLYSTSNGSDTVRVASFVTVNGDLPPSKGESGNYAYVTSGEYSTKNASNETVYGVSMWNGTKAVTVLYDTSKSLKAGDIIKYSDLGDGKIEDIKTIAQSDLAVVAKETMGLAAIKGITDGGKTLNLVKANSEVGSTASTDKFGEYVITKDTKYLYVDTDKDVGEDAGSVNIAMQDTVSNKLIYKGNVVVYTDTNNNEIDLIVVDVNNEWM